MSEGTTRRMRATTVRFGTDLWEMLEREARRSGVSVAQYVREAALTRVAYSAGRRGEPAFGESPGEAHEVVSGGQLGRAAAGAQRTEELGDAVEAVRRQGAQAMRQAHVLVERGRREMAASPERPPRRADS